LALFPAVFFSLILPGFMSFSEYLYPEASTRLPELEATEEAVSRSWRLASVVLEHPIDGA